MSQGLGLSQPLHSAGWSLACHVGPPDALLLPPRPSFPGFLLYSGSRPSWQLVDSCSFTISRWSACTRTGLSGSGPGL